jgi:hypothetical protein
MISAQSETRRAINNQRIGHRSDFPIGLAVTDAARCAPFDSPVRRESSDQDIRIKRFKG